MTGRRAGEFWFRRLPAGAGRRWRPLGTVLSDGAHLHALPWLAAVAPPAAFGLGLAAGWLHPTATDLYTTSVVVMAVMLGLGTLSAALGAWLVLGYAIGDLALAARVPAFTGSFSVAVRTWLALILCDIVLALLAVLIPLCARTLAGDLTDRFRSTRGAVPHALLTALVAAAMVFAWAQAAVILTRPYFTWHALAPTNAALSALAMSSLVLPIVAAGAVAVRATVEARWGGAAIAPQPEPAGPGRRLPAVLAILWRVAISVFLLSGLMDSWVDALVVAVVMGALLSLREPALHRLGGGLNRLTRVPALPRLLTGMALCAVAGTALVSIAGKGSLVRPIVISTMLSLVVFSVLLPEHVIHDKSAGPSLARPSSRPA